MKAQEINYITRTDLKVKLETAFGYSEENAYVKEEYLNLRKRIEDGAKVSFYYCSSTMFIPSCVKRSKAHPEIIVVSTSRILYLQKAREDELQYIFNRPLDDTDMAAIAPSKLSDGKYFYETPSHDDYAKRNMSIRFFLVPENAKYCDVITDIEFEAMFADLLPDFTVEDVTTFKNALGTSDTRLKLDPTKCTIIKTLGGYNWHTPLSYAHLMWVVRDLMYLANPGSIIDLIKQINYSAYKLIRYLRDDTSVNYRESTLADYMRDITQREIELEEEFLEKEIYPYMKNIIIRNTNNYFYNVKDWENKILK